MEIILTIVVASAVIFFGALISMGNDRQRKAIDELREQVVLWAIQDLKIKREHLVRTIQITDPMAWINKAISHLIGCNLNLQLVEIIERPQALVFLSETDGGGPRIILSPCSPEDLKQNQKNKLNRLSTYSSNNSLLHLSKDAVVYELSTLNGGILFDLELSLAWKQLTGDSIVEIERIWVYQV